MSFRFKRQETVAKGLRRIFTSELQSAAKGLLPAEAGGNRDTAIHEARKSVKKARGVLRLAEPRLGAEYRPLNTRLRDVGRRLSEFRDAGAMLETVAALEQEYPDELGKAKLAAVRAALARQKEKAEHAAHLETVFADLAAELQAVAARADQWDLSGDGFDAIEPGFKQAFRRGRKALDRALERGRDTDFHDWRKRVKDHWYHVRLLEPCDQKLAAYGKLLRQLETWLGDDHNLVVLHGKLRHDAQLQRNATQAQAALALAARRRDDLRSKSIELGRELYRVKPKHLAAMVREAWEKWR